ncbi:MAG: hypothetical protein U1E17_07970 [Geminicoccaceae bacterium]
MTAAIKRQLATMGTEKNGWHVTLHGFGDREMYAGNWALRAAAAMAGIYGNDAVEALYPCSRPMPTATSPTARRTATLTFPVDGLPPVNALWSVTVASAARRSSWWRTRSTAT